MSPRRYLATLAAATVGLIAAAAVLSWAVDPFGYFGTPRVEGFNARKTEAAAFTALTKAGQVTRAQPQVVLFGTSRVDIGFDPLHPVWASRQQRVYNYGLPDASVLSAREQLAHVLALSPVKSVVVGIEFQDFLRGALPAPGATDEVKQRFIDLAQDPQAWPRVRRQWLDAGSATATLPALLASAATIAAQHRARGGDVSPLGLTSERPYRELVAREGQNALFVQKNRDLAAARVKAAQRLERPDAPRFVEMQALEGFLAFARERGVQVTLVVPPYHAHFLEIVDAAGLWPVFEDWKRRLVGEVERHNAAAAGAAPVALWDFAIYDERTTEAVPPAGDRRTQLRWFWEPVHFSKALGDVIVRRITGAEATGFGAELNAGNIEAWLAADRGRRDAYRTLRATEVAGLVELVRSAKGQQAAAVADAIQRKH